ncbi:MAG: hypothetical protein J3R72DRAFT_498818 [Linnemannia gamsii]|nr:MAG: hypothetical protein J3R72DRAFT_498818 [Linnemannia gamsii]
MLPSIPKLSQTRRSILLSLLQLLILSISLTLVYYIEVFFRCRTIYAKDPASLILVSLAIPLFWILPIYLVIAPVNLFLLNRPQSTYGHRPTWISSKERYFAILFPTLAAFGLASYLLEPAVWDSYAPEDEYTPGNCKQRARPPLTLILSVLVLIESYITYRIDITQLDLHQPPPATCGKSFCLHKCVSTVTNSHISATPPLSSTYCTSVRMIRNTRIIALVIGTFYMAFIVITALVLDTGTDRWWMILSHILSLLLWLLIITSIFRPTVTRPAQDLHPTLRLVLSLIPALAVLVYNGLFLISGDKDIALFMCRLLGILFSLLMAFEVVVAVLFDRRRYNTARKVDVWMMQQQKYELPSQQLNGGGAEFAMELVNIEGKFQEAASLDGKIVV